MVNRKDLKSAHEDAVLRQFGVHLKCSGINFKILGRPEPPDAFVEISEKKSWIEITDSFLDKRHAIGLTTRASDDVEHSPDDSRLVIDPDEKFSKTLYSIVAKKYDKPSMHRIAEVHGPGILLVGVFTPFTTADAVSHDESAAIAEIISSKPVQVFRTIYTYDGTGQRNFHVLYSQ